MRILFVVHGYPPRESAGTEVHARQLADSLCDRGHTVHVFAATRAPGRAQYEVIHEPGITRVVNNIATRTLGSGERDHSIERIVREVIEEFGPDLVHVHHIQFLSAGMRFAVPTVATLHDQWAWCASGGLGLEPAGTICPGPAPHRCAPCHAAWRPAPSSWARTLTRTAGWLSCVIAPDRLHHLYRRIPPTLRPSAVRGAHPVERGEDAAHRNRAVLSFYQAADVRIAPSRYLASLAESNGTGAVDVVPHGAPPCPVDAPDPSERTGPILSLGTISKHKGTDRVVTAWRRAFPSEQPQLALHGPVLEAEAACGHPVGPVLDRTAVWTALSQARVLVLGSRWPENAPLVVLEARAAGCPVIAPDIGGLPELVTPGRDGWLYPPDEPDALVQALQSAVQTAAPRPTLPRTLDAQVDDTVTAYERAIDAHRRNTAALGTG